MTMKSTESDSDQKRRERVAKLIAEMNWDEVRWLGLNSTVVLQCKRGEVPQFREATIARVLGEYGA